MERNPYAPPVSAVADPVEVRAERPPEVTLAVKLLWASFFLGLVALFYQPALKNAAAPGQWVGVLIGMAIIFGLWAWVISKIARGRNWARVLFLVIGILGTVINLLATPMVLSFYKAQPLSGVIALINFVLEIYTIYLLLTAPARAWFKQPSP